VQQRQLRLGLFAALLFALVGPAPVFAQNQFAQNQPRCEPGQVPTFVFGFAALKAQLGDSMGEPASCEYADPNGTGDTLQDTSRGLAFWRKSTNTPTFTNGGTHWASTPQGFVTWTGARVDPPALAGAPPAPAPSTPAAPPPATAPTPPSPPAAPQPATPAPPSPPAAPSTPPAAAAAPTCGATSNPWGFTFCGGATIATPPVSFCSVFACIPSFWNQTNGYVIQCKDGVMSHSGGVRGSCSSHGGNSRPLYSAR
jgi:hypothetical protein